MVLPSPSRKKCRGDLPLWLMYARIAATGHKSHPVRPNRMSAPAPNWSHLDFLRCILTKDGAELQPTATSPHERWLAAVYSASVPTSNSPRRKKPKNATVAIAQNARRSGSASGDLLISVRICLSTVTVMGIRMRGVPLFCVARALRMPSSTLFSTGSVDSSRGQGSPRDNCMLRTADRYTLIVWGARPSLASFVAK